MNVIEKNISFLVENQFPDFYKDFGPDFIEFVRVYYEWLEQTNNTTYHTRRLLEYQDIDETIDIFLAQFKEKYLKNIKIDSVNNTRNLVKHSLDLYRSKGTERGIDLLFRTEFGVGAEIYYPSTDLFRTSDGNYRKTRYLEVTINDNLNLFLNKEIYGIKTKATAFVERVIRRTIKNRIIDVLYINTIVGEFETGEIVNTIGNILTVDKCPTIIGSLNEFILDEVGFGSGFKVGDVVDIFSDSGAEASGIVSKTTSFSGQADFQLIDGGYGYTANANVYVSSLSVRVANVTGNYNFNIFDTITQPKAILNYLNANNSFIKNTNVYSYHANNLLMGRGEILEVFPSNTTAGTLLITVANGNFNTLAIYNLGNTVSSNLAVSNGYFVTTASANYIDTDKLVRLNLINVSGTFESGSLVYQTNAVTQIIETTGTCKTYFEGAFSDGTLLVERDTGYFDLTKPIFSGNSFANCTSATITIGVNGVTNTFISTPGNILTTNNFSGTIEYIDTGQGATFGISNNLLYTENITIYNDTISTFASVALNANTYGFSGNTSANISSVIDTSFGKSNLVIGKITNIVNINPGRLYTNKPYSRIVDSKIAPFNIPNFILGTGNSDASFFSGELVTQADTNARGIITPLSNNVYQIQNLRFYSNNFFQTGINIVGENSGAVANVSFVVTTFTDFEGQNAKVNEFVLAGNGAVTAIEVIDSGYGFRKNEALSFSSNNNVIGTGIPKIYTHGVSTGNYRTTDGFASDKNKLFDGDYWQYHSYEVRTSITLDKYSNILRQIMHLAGTKFFGAFIQNSTANVSPITTKTTITIS